jgi:NTP pyrophosphatase (non-canonical NTP hydrolase)
MTDLNAAVEVARTRVIFDRLIDYFAELNLGVRRSGAERVSVSAFQKVLDQIEEKLRNHRGELPHRPAPRTLRTVQDEHRAWQAHNFSAEVSEDRARDALLGVTEEVGELAHAMLKLKQGIRGTPEEHRAAAKDAVGDTLIYLLDFCTRMDWDAQEILEETWAGVRQRDWKKYPKTGLPPADEAEKVAPIPDVGHVRFKSPQGTFSVLGDQPKPAGRGPVVADRLIEMIRERKEVGIQRYGEPLRADNGRDALRDAFEEMLDGTKYLLQLIIEREELGMHAELKPEGSA